MDVLAKALRQHADRYKAIEAVRDEATATFQRMKLSTSLKRHAFQAVGWGRFPGESTIEPFLYLISNFAGSDSWLPEANAAFDLRRVRPGPAALAVYPAGQDLPERELNQLVRRLSQPVKRKAGAAAAARLIAESVRNLRNKAVSKAVLITVLPKPDPDRQCGAQTSAAMPPMTPRGVADYFAGAISDSEPSFLYLPEDSGAKPIAWGPALVGSDIQMKGIEFGVLADDDHS